MEKQNSMKINQLPSKTWYWLGLNDTKVKWAAGAPCEICAEEPSGRVPELHRAAPSAVLYMHPADAQKRGLKRNDVAQITSRRGSIKALVETQGRMKMPRGTVWMAFFDESVQVNKLCIDATVVIFLIVTACHICHPVFVFKIPFDRFLDAFCKHRLRIPANLTSVILSSR